MQGAFLVYDLIPTIQYLNTASMTRQQHLEFCTICHNQAFNTKHGVICKLTDQIADFKDECESFEKDEKKEELAFIKKMDSAGKPGTGDATDFEKNKTNGTIWIALGIGVLLFTLTVDGSPIVIVPFGALIYGVTVYSKGVNQEKLWNANQDKEQPTPEE